MPNDLIGGILPRQIPVNAPEEDLIGGVLPRQIPSVSPMETLPEENKPITPVPSLITTFSGMVGDAASRLGKATGLPNLENIGEDIKAGTEIMKTEGMEAVGKVPGASELTGFYGGMTGEQLAPTAPLPEDAGMIRQATVGAARLLGMGVALTPVGRALRGIGLAAPIAGAISLGGYGALEKLPNDASRLGHIATMAAFGFAFPLAGSALEAVASKIPAIGNVFAKVKAGVPLSSGEVAIKKAVEVGQSSMLMGGAGAAEGKTWEERTKNFFIGFLMGGLAHVATDAGSKAFGLAKDTKLPVGKGLNVEEALRNPEASDTERRLAGNITGNRMAGQAYVNKALWEEFCKEKIANKLPINPTEFDDFISREWNRTSSEIAKNKTLSDVEKMTLNQKLQTMPTERTPEENERALADIVKDKIQKGMLLSSDEIALSKKHGLLRDADIQLMSAITPKKPMTEEEIAAQLKIIPTEEVAALRAKLRAREITTGQEAGVKEIPMGTKLGEPEIIKGKPKELPPTGKQYGEGFVTIPESERIKPEIKPVEKGTIKLLPHDVVYTKIGNKNIEVIQNPSPNDIYKLSQEVIKLFPNMPKGEPKIRFTFDKDGNKYIWKSNEATHLEIEDSLGKLLNKELNQNIPIVVSEKPVEKGTIKVYTGSDAPFNKFDISKIGTRTDAGFAGRGAYTTTDFEKASRWGKHVMETEIPSDANFIEINKISELYSKYGMEQLTEKESALPKPERDIIYKNKMDSFAQKMVKDGYDGVKWNMPKGDIQYALFKPENFEFKPVEKPEIKPTETKEIQKVEKGTILTPEIQVAQEEQKVKNLETLTDEELNNKIKSGELDTKWLYRNVRNMSPEFVKRLDAIVPIRINIPYIKPPDKIGKSTQSRFGYNIAENKTKMVESDIRQALESGTEPISIKEVIAGQGGEILKEYESIADKDIIKDYFNEARNTVDKIAKEVIPAKGMMAGKLSYAALKETGKAFYQEGKNTFDAFRKSFIDLYGQEGFSTERNNILKAFTEIKNEFNKPPEIREDGYKIAGEPVGGQVVETFRDEMDRRIKTEYFDIKDELGSFIKRNYERTKDYVSGLPDKEQEKIINQMAKNLGLGNFIKAKISNWVKVPIWDAEMSFIPKFLHELSAKSIEVTNEFLGKNDFLRGTKITDNIRNALYKTTVKQTPIDWDKLNPQERKIVEKIFANTQWMFDKFIEEMRANAEQLKPDAKKAGFDNVDDYINEFDKQHRMKYYVPLTRGDGNNVLVVKGKDNVTLWSENFETKVEAKKRALELYKEIGKSIEDGANITMFDARSKYGFEFPRILEMLHDLPYMRNMIKSKLKGDDIAKDALVQELEDILSSSYLSLWAKGRLAKREAIPGFSMDIKKTLNDYAHAFPRSYMRRWNAGKLADLVEKVPEDKQQYAKNNVDFYLGRRDYEGSINFAARNIIFNWNLLLKPAFGAINLTQRGSTTFWRAYKELGMEGAKITLKSQWKEISFYKELMGKRLQGMSTNEAINSSNVLSREDKNIILKLHDRGELEAVRNLEIIGRNRLSRALNIFGTISEKSNRFHSALTASEIGKIKGYKGDTLYDYVTDFVYKTQWLYGKENRPEIGRGWKAPLFVFKTYVLNDLNFLKDLYPNKKAFSGAVATRLALGGLGGMYGVGTITSAIDWAMINIVGKKDWDLSKEEAKIFMENKYGKGLVDIATRGLPSMVGIEGSISLGSPDLFDIAGVPLVKGVYTNIKIALEEKGIDWGEFIRRNSPAIVKHQMGMPTQTIFGKEKVTIDDIKLIPIEIRKRAYEFYKTLPNKMNDKYKMLYALGFTTTTSTDYYNAINAIKGASREVRKYKAGVHREIGRAIAENRRNSVRDLIEDAKARGIKLNTTAIMEQAKKYKITEMMEEEKASEEE